MKIAIFHNFLDNIGGAEIVDLIMAKELGADIYTTNIDQKKIRSMGFTTDNIYSIGRIPVHAPFKQEAAYWKFRRLHLAARYDFYIIAGDWAVGAARHHHPNIWYVYSPIREIWDLYHTTRSTIVPWYQRPAFDGWVKFHRHLNHRDVTFVDSVVAISEVVQGRVKQYLNREATVIYPPVDVDSFYYRANGNFWLSVNRLVRYKRIEMQLDAFRQLPDQQLVVVGSYESAHHFQKYRAELERRKPANATIKSWVDHTELRRLYAECRGVISTSTNEDYGLTAVEAMASGKPIIAPNEGGYRESVVNGKCGKLIDNIDAGKLIAAILEIGDHPQRYKEDCLNQAKKFDLESFITKINKEIKFTAH